MGSICATDDEWRLGQPLQMSQLRALLAGAGRGLRERHGAGRPRQVQTLKCPPHNGPCGPFCTACRESVAAKPPRVDSALELNTWLCELHNEVGCACTELLRRAPLGLRVSSKRPAHGHRLAVSQACVPVAPMLLVAQVNDLLGKPAFDCGKVTERWRDGPADATCD